MSKLTKLCRAKFDQIAGMNKEIDAGVKGVAAAKRRMIERQTDGRTARERQPACNLGDAWNPNGLRHARGRDDTGWINKNNAGKAGKFAGVQP